MMINNILKRLCVELLDAKLDMMKEGCNDKTASFLIILNAIKMMAKKDNEFNIMEAVGYATRDFDRYNTSKAGFLVNTDMYDGTEIKRQHVRMRNVVRMRNTLKRIARKPVSDDILGLINETLEKTRGFQR